jgi:hypothetical protein
MGNRRMRATIAILPALFVDPALAGPCDDVGRAIADRTKATIEAITPVLGNVRFVHSAAYEMTLFCGMGAPALFLAYEGKRDVRFLALAAVSGGVLLGGQLSVGAIGDCLLAAAIDPFGEAQRDSGQGRLECAADVPNRSGNVTIKRHD